MHVLLLTHAFPPDHGGVESFSYALAQGMAEDHGVRVTVATWTSPHLPDEDTLLFRVVRNPGARELYSLMRESDVVLENSAFLKLAGIQVAARRPRVRILHDRQNSGAVGKTHPLKRKLARAVVAARTGWTRTAQVVVGVSRDVAEGAGFPSAEVIHNGYDGETFRRITAPACRDPNSLITVSRLHHGKGTDMAVRALRSLRERGVPATLTVVGGGPERTRLEELARQIGVESRVTFTGPLAPPQVNEKLNEAAIYALPARDYESFGIAIVEAQAAGCAVVCADRGGIPEAVHGHGLLFPSEDQHAFTETLYTLMTQPQTRAAAITPEHEMRGRTNTAMVAEYVRLLHDVARV